MFNFLMKKNKKKRRIISMSSFPFSFYEREMKPNKKKK